VLGPLLSPYITAEGADTLAHEFMVRCRRVVRHETIEAAEACQEELCNCDFSLAYGASPHPSPWPTMLLLTLLPGLRCFSSPFSLAYGASPHPSPAHLASPPLHEKKENKTLSGF
jgi:hypothetical protein